MAKKRGDRAHRTAEKRARRGRRQLAREEKLREEHTRLVLERSHDPRFTQRTRHDDGSTVYQWPIDSPLNEYFREMLGRQAERFRTKFGRDPGPEDPIFFDPDADEPRPVDPDTATHDINHELRDAGREAGIDPAFIEAWCELGYVVTEDTRHLFSAGDVAAWDEAVRRHAGDLNADRDLDANEASNKDMPDSL